MKNFHQNLLIALALCLCGLCASQWYDETVQRRHAEGLNQLLTEKSAAIQGYTNSIGTLNQQVAEMDARITELRNIGKTNEQQVILQKRELSQLDLQNQVLTNTVAQYKQAVDTLQARLKEAYDGIQKQNDAISNLTVQRDEFVQKLNDSVKDRNDIVGKYNDLVQKLQAAGGKQQP
jgi:chromosome segregation ATPase